MIDVKCAYIQIQVKGESDDVSIALDAIKRFCARDKRIWPLLDGIHCEDVELSALRTAAGPQPEEGRDAG